MYKVNHSLCPKPFQDLFCTERGVKETSWFQGAILLIEAEKQIFIQGTQNLGFFKKLDM